MIALVIFLDKYIWSCNNHRSDDMLDLLNQVKSLPEVCEESKHLSQFSLRHVTFGEVPSKISQLRSHCSTGYDQIPVRYVKLAKDYLAG